jgi:pectate lyase-like protein
MKSTLWAVVIACVLALGCAITPEPVPVDTTRGMHNVIDHGAKGDGETDDTQAFQAALDAAAKDGGGVVFAPTGTYLIATHLDIPQGVTLEGVWRGPNRGHDPPTGTTLLAVEGKGDPDGTPFLSMHWNSMLKGLTIFYPEQIVANPPHAYPWTVRGEGDNITIIDVLMRNTYQAVDFGTNPCGRHYINGLYAQALYRGIFVDRCFDVGRIENVHLWPFWRDDQKLHSFVRENAVAFTFGRTDWEYVFNSFAIFYKTGFLFTEFDHGPGNVLVTQSGSDIGPVAVRVENVQGHAGVTFANCQMMATVEVAPTNTGPVKFTATGFWPIPETREQARLEGSGHVFFEACHFSDWDVPGGGVPCIQANSTGLTVLGCDFMASGKPQITLGDQLQAAVITGNRLRGGARIVNGSAGDVQIGLNTQN